MEEGERVAERRGERVRHPVEDRAQAVVVDPSQVESLGAPVGSAGECGVAFKLDGDKACRRVVAEGGERLRVCIWIGPCQGAAVLQDEMPVLVTAVRVSRDWAQLREGADKPSFDVDCVSWAQLASMKGIPSRK